LGLSVPLPVISALARIPRKRAGDPIADPAVDDTPNITFDFLTDKLLATDYFGS
jgi:hypothetical protein